MGISNQTTIVRVMLLLITAMIATNAAFGAEDKNKVEKLEAELIREILTRRGEYGKYSKPVLNRTTPVKVNMAMTVRQLIELNLPDQYIEFQGWLRFYWNDTAMKWNYTEYDDIKEVQVHTSDIWTPDITIYNSMEGEDPTKLLDGRTSITHEGEISILLPKIIQASCHVSISDFPYDYQVCQVTFGSWSYDIRKIDLYALDERGDLSKYHEHNLLKMDNVTAKRVLDKQPCCPAPFVIIEYSLAFKRLPLYYMINFIIPCTVLAILSSFVFVLPVGEGEKIGFALTLLLGMAVYQMIFVEYLPATSTETPQLTVYFGVLILQLGMETICQVLILKVHFDGEEGAPVPKVIRSLVFGALATLLCARKRANLVRGKGHYGKAKVNGGEQLKLENCNETEKLNSNDSSDQEQNAKEWAFVALMLDRLCFVIFFGLTLILLGIFLYRA